LAAGALVQHVAVEMLGTEQAHAMLDCLAQSMEK
jgi:hypothetical protein